MKEGVSYFVGGILIAELTGWGISYYMRHYTNHPSQLKCRQCGREGKSNINITGNFKGGRKCLGCNHLWDAEIRKQWRFPLFFVVLGCWIIIFSGTNLILVYIGYLLIIAAKAGVLRRVEASDTRWFLIDGMKARGGRERFRFIANLIVVPLSVYFLSPNLLLGLCIFCSAILFNLSFSTRPK